jgi:hypothetical protein
VLGYRLSQIADTVDWGSYADRVNLSKHTVEDWAMRLVTAAGRFWEQDVKKPWRDGSPLNRLIALGHMRDILRALAGIADEYGYTMGQVAQTNIDKLVERRQRGTLTGSGDNR